MKNLLIILPLLLIGCSSEAQRQDSQKEVEAKETKVVVKDGILISFEGFDVSKYELDVEDFDVREITKNNLLCLATQECDENLVRGLLEKGANANFKCEEVDDVITNLAFCKENGVLLTDLLLSKGADINGADEDNDSFLSYAISYDNYNLAKYLIEKGANKEQRDTNRNMGCFPVHGVESVKMLELLIANNFEINSLCDNGRNLLHFAAKDDLKQLANHLIENQLVEINHKDKNGETPLDYAVRLNNPEIAEMIKKKK